MHSCFFFILRTLFLWILSYQYKFLVSIFRGRESHVACWHFVHPWNDANVNLTVILWFWFVNKWCRVSTLTQLCYFQGLYGVLFKTVAFVYICFPYLIVHVHHSYGLIKVLQSAIGNCGIYDNKLSGECERFLFASLFNST